MTTAKTLLAGHFSTIEVADQINAMIERFLAVGLSRWLGKLSEVGSSAHLLLQRPYDISPGREEVASIRRPRQAFAPRLGCISLPPIFARSS
jgi:hypothetical protein